MRKPGPGLWALLLSDTHSNEGAHQPPEIYREVLPRVSELLEVNHIGELWPAAH